MLLSSYNLARNVEALSTSDPVYGVGFIIGALIPLVIGYFLFRLKVENKSEMKKFLEETIYLRELYDKSEKESSREQFIVDSLVNDNVIDLEKQYYYLKLSQLDGEEVREWNSVFVLCKSEALALKAKYEN